MATKLFTIGTMFLMIGIVSAQYWNQPYSYNRQYYPRQRQPYPPPFQSNNAYQQLGSFQLPPGVSLSNAEWVCKNPKTNDMMIIASENGPVSNDGSPNQGGQNPWTSPNYPTTATQINTNQPTAPQVNPVQPNETPNIAPTTTPNTNGDGLIDIRLGNQ